MLNYIPFLKNSPAAPFLTGYYPDGVGMSAVDTSMHCLFHAWLFWYKLFVSAQESGALEIQAIITLKYLVVKIPVSFYGAL